MSSLVQHAKHAAWGGQRAKRAPQPRLAAARESHATAGLTGAVAFSGCSGNRKRVVLALFRLFTSRNPEKPKISRFGGRCGHQNGRPLAGARMCIKTPALCQLFRLADQAEVVNSEGIHIIALATAKSLHF